MQNKHLSKLLTPSWVVNFVGLAVGVLVTAAVIVLSRYEHSELRQQIFENQAKSSSDTTAGTYHAIAANIADNSFLGALPLLLTWAAVGLVVYYFAMAIARSLGSAVGLREQLGYVHSSRQALMRQAMVNLGIRAAAVVGWFVFIKLSLSIFVPYALAAASLAAELSLASVGYALLAIAVLYLVIYVSAIFLRLIVLRSRLFGG